MSPATSRNNIKKLHLLQILTFAERYILLYFFHRRGRGTKIFKINNVQTYAIGFAFYWHYHLAATKPRTWNKAKIISQLYKNQKQISIQNNTEIGKLQKISKAEFKYVLNFYNFLKFSSNFPQTSPKFHFPSKPEFEL